VQGESATCLATRLDGTPQAVVIDIKKTDATAWHLQFNLPGVAVKAGQYYTFTSRPRRQEPPAHVRRRAGPRAVERPGSFADGHAGDEMKPYPRRSSQRTARHARVGFMSAARCCRRDRRRRLRHRRHDGSARMNRSRSPAWPCSRQRVAQRTEDRMRFLPRRRSYFDGMYSFVKKDIACKALVTGTIVFGRWAVLPERHGLCGRHAYCSTRSFREGRGTRQLARRSAVDGGASRGIAPVSPLLRAAGGQALHSQRVQPPAPTIQAQCVRWCGVRGLAGLDGIWLFAYSHTDKTTDTSHMVGFFDIAAIRPSGLHACRNCDLQGGRDFRRHHSKRQSDSPKEPTSSPTWAHFNASTITIRSRLPANPYLWMEKAITARLYVHFRIYMK